MSDADCLGRSKTPLGSSSSWGPGGNCSGAAGASSPVCFADGGANGMLANTADANPAMYAWTKVFINYCDGASYASDVDKPIAVGAANIYYRGAANLAGVYDELAASHGLRGAATVLVSGCSAGGLAVYLHVDALAEKVRAIAPAARVLGAPGAGFFLFEAAPFAGSGYLADIQWVVSAGNVTAHVNARCLAAFSSTPWRCFIAPDTLPFIETPLFISNSLSDAWQAGAVMGLGCSPTHVGACSAEQIAYLSDFRRISLVALAPVTRAGSIHGAFLQGCFVHVVEDTAGWTRVIVENQTQSDTFSAWLAGGAGGSTVVVGDFPPWSNPTC